MDPNANLEEQRRIRQRFELVPEHERLALLERLLDLSEALDEWLQGGGFLPRAWLQARVIVTAREAAAQKGVEYDPEDEVVGRL